MVARINDENDIKIIKIGKYYLEFHYRLPQFGPQHRYKIKIREHGKCIKTIVQFCGIATFLNNVKPDAFFCIAELLILL